MKATHEQIIKIIRESILSEVGPHDSPFDDYVTTVAAGFDPPPKTDSTAIAELILGFTPVGIALDAYDMWSALVNKNPQMFALAAVGFIPGIGDLRNLRKSHLDEVAENLGPDGMARLQAQADEAVDATASSSNIGRISVPVVRRTSREFLDVEYRVAIDGSSYYVDFVRRSHNAPVEISFIAASAADAGELVYNMTGRGHPFKVLRGVLDTVADFTKKFPEEKSFIFRGFSGDDMAFNWGTASVTKRTRVFRKFMERAISRDPELSTMVKKISDLSWADDPNTIKIDLNELKRIIREELLREQVFDGPPIMDPSVHTEWERTGAAEKMRHERQANVTDASTARMAAEILLGFTPAGVAIDFIDLATAIEKRDPALAAMAGIGFIPVVGDLFKVPYKAAKAKVLDDIASELGPKGLNQLRRKSSNILGVSRSVRSVIEDGMSKPGVYRVHVVIADRPLESFINNGLAIKPGRATTGPVDSADDFLNPKTVFGKPLSPNSGSAQAKRVLIRYPEGTSLSDAAEEFNWSEIPGFKGRTVATDAITHRIPPEYIVGVVDPMGDIFVKGMGY